MNAHHPIPQGLEAERAVLSAMLLSADCISIVRAQLFAEAFSLPVHRRIYHAICDTYYAEGAIDQLLLAECLRARGELEGVGGIVYLATLAEEVVTAANVERHAAVVLGHALARDALAETHRLQTALADGEGVEAIQASAARLRTLADGRLADADRGTAGGQVIAAEGEDYAARHTLAEQGRTFFGWDTGFNGLNDRLNGLCPGELSVLGADQGVGKTTLACQIFHSVISAGECAAYVTQEEPGRLIGARLTLIEADGVSPDRRRRGMLTSEEDQRIRQARRVLAGYDWCCYERCRSMAAIELQMRTGVRRRPVGLWVIDHLHRTSGHGESRHLELSGIVKRCKDLALELDTRVLLLSQLARAKDRLDRRPRIDDLRESGSIEEHADNVVLLYRPGRYDHLRDAAAKKGPGALQDLLAEAYGLCEKTRYGVVGNVKLVWRGDVALFGNAFLRTM